MKNKELVITGLLVVSLGFNYFTWSELKDLKNYQQGFAQKNDVQWLRNEISSLRNNLKKIEKQNEWIQETNFEVIKGKSNFNSIYVQGEWTFKELSDDQVPYLSLEENNKWQEIKLEKQNGLTYGTQLKLSPQKQHSYNYKIYTKGTINKSTEVRSIPYEKYGLPEARVKFGGTSSNTKPEISLQFACDLYPEKAPIEEMRPKAIYLEVVRNGEIEQTIPFSLDDNNNSIWEAYWTLESRENAPDYTLFIITKFKNGFEQRKQIEQFERWAEKIITERINNS